MMLVLARGAAAYEFTSKAELQGASLGWVTNPSGTQATYGHISTWGTGQITDMSYLFCGASFGASYGCNVAFQNFDANISGWITSQVTNMNCMFYRAYSFNHSLAFDTGKVTTMSSMFYDASSFNQPLTFDTSKVTTMSSMFDGASSIYQPLTDVT